MKRWTWMTMAVLALLPLAAARADHRIDWDDWYGGEVDVNVKVKRGEGAVYAVGEPVRIEFKANEDAYHMVYAIDTEGYVRLLFPRYWEDDGWVEAGRKVKLRERDLAWPADRWGTEGIVYIEAIASPTPFDFHRAGLVREASSCGWYDGHRALRVNDDPFLAFNDVHRRLFADWDNAVFAVDYTYFYVGDYYEAPRYLGYRYRRVYVQPPHAGFHIGVRFGWSWEFGYGYCRPVYARYYVPGVHYVHHHVYHHHHVAYRHTHHRYGRHGHYGYRDGWHGSQYRVVHDTKSRRRITPPPERKRYGSVVRLREALDRKGVERRDGVRAPDRRKRDERRDVGVEPRGRRERAANAARSHLDDRRKLERRAPAVQERRAPRREVADRPNARRAPAVKERRAPRQAVESRLQRNARPSRDAVQKRSSSSERKAQRAERPRRSEKKHAVGEKLPARSKSSSVVRSKSQPRSKADGAKGSERKAKRSARSKKASRR